MSERCEHCGAIMLSQDVNATDLPRENLAVDAVKRATEILCAVGLALPQQVSAFALLAFMETDDDLAVGFSVDIPADDFKELLRRWIALDDEQRRLNDSTKH